MKPLASTILLLTVLFTTSCQNKKTSTVMTDNPILQPWENPFNAPPFDQIENKHYLPAFEQAISKHNEELEQIVSNPDAPTFENTIEALEFSGEDLGKVKRLFYAVNSAHTNDELQKVAETMAPQLAAHQDEIMLNEALFQRIKTVYEQKDTLDLDSEQLKLLEETYQSFMRSGANVSKEQKSRLKAINTKLAELSQKFGNNVLKETNDFELYIEDEALLGNLSESTKANAAALAKDRGHENGWSFSAQRPMVNPLLQSSPDEATRKAIYNGYADRGNQDNASDNKTIIKEIVTLRAERAQLLGYKTHAEYVLSDNMAKSPEKVFEFMDELWPSALKMAKEERDELAAKKKKSGNNAVFKGWDWRYYVEQIRKEKYDFDEVETKPYFELNNVVKGAFLLANKLYGLTFKKLDNVPTWHEDQDVFEVLEKDGSHLGLIYMDYYARPSKRGGAWMNELLDQHYKDGTKVAPIVTNNFNFPKATADTPSLLTIREAETVFHEFGHGLHGLFSDVKYRSLSGTNVPRDFVEFPSQVMENWMSEPEFLKTFAVHYKTGEPIPDALIEKIKKANKFNQGFATVEYMAAAYLDMYYHTLENTDELDVSTFEDEKLKQLGLIDEIISRYKSGYFNHVFSGGYSAGYYSYLWSEVLDSDAFAAFKESGDLYNQELAKKFRYLLSKGGTVDGMELYKTFRGQEPKIDALLKRKGF
ncbi:MAG: peptidase M3 [Flavobacteriia bacterium]|nr:MAG: peptidase M3 [Flavobacteriia bacterium]